MARIQSYIIDLATNNNASRETALAATFLHEADQRETTVESLRRKYSHVPKYRKLFSDKEFREEATRLYHERIKPVLERFEQSQRNAPKPEWMTVEDKTEETPREGLEERVA